MNTIIKAFLFLLCVYIMAIVVVETSEKEVWACSEDYHKIPTKYKKLCPKEWKNEQRLLTKYHNA